MTNAAGAAQGVRREVDTLVQSQVERVLNDLDLVKREEFEAVRAMAQKAREENDALAAAHRRSRSASSAPPVASDSAPTERSVRLANAQPDCTAADRAQRFESSINRLWRNQLFAHASPLEATQRLGTFACDGLDE